MFTYLAYHLATRRGFVIIWVTLPQS